MSDPIKTTNPDGTATYQSMGDRDIAAEAVQGVAKAAVKLVDAFSNAADMSANMPADIRELLRSASSDIKNAPDTAFRAKAAADKHLANDMLYPAGRERLAKQEIGDAMAKVTEILDGADTKIDVADALLYQAARPAMPAGADVAARSDVKMVLDAANGLDMADSAKELAKRSDAVGALVADQGWLSLYMQSRKVDPRTADAIKVIVRNEMLQAAAESDDPKRVATGRTALALVNLRKAVIAARGYQRNAL
ncbi:hypothetical protein ABZX90_37070 [Streptomyces sp. NPDC002935]|uniref:hypothetical protein n=1 Tax=Streptomyces sp. NPDC002935 TaxID=3154545 RepID=UPI0033ABBE30